MFFSRTKCIMSVGSPRITNSMFVCVFSLRLIVLCFSFGYPGVVVVVVCTFFLEDYL